ncbi:hypothetical protein EDC01DRAFT_432518 [Geopyxis carbonaria]|nr:hypothetical protein EDC01DRAFT_432518 [Geopyxis carbonaria]
MSTDGITSTEKPPLATESQLPEPPQVNIGLNGAQKAKKVPLQNANTISSVDGNTPTMLRRQSTLPAAGTRAKTFFSNQMRRKRKDRTSSDPVMSAVNENEGAPASRDKIRQTKPDKNAIMEAANAHITAKASAEGQILDVIFPEFDDLHPYSVPESSASEMLRREVSRLAAIIEYPDVALRFGNQDLLTEGSENGYTKLSALFTWLRKAMAICSLDNTAIALAYCPKLTSKRKVQGKMRTVQSGIPRGADFDLNPEVSEDLNKKELEACYCLLDFLSAVLVRLTAHSGYGDYWLNNLVGVIAKWTVKAKVLLIDMRTNSSISLRLAETIVDGAPDGNSLKTERVEEEGGCDEVQASLVEKAGSLKLNEDSAVSKHCFHQLKFRTGTDHFLRYQLSCSHHMNRSGLPVTSYEVCAVVYETGFEGFKALLFQDRDYEFSATSELSSLNVSHAAFGILNQSLLDIRREPRMPMTVPPSATADGLQTEIEWNYLEEEKCQSSKASELEKDSGASHKNRLVFSHMEDIVTVMILLTTTSPVMVATFNQVRDIVAISGDIEDVVLPYADSKFDAFFRMWTNKFVDTSTRRDVLRLSQAVDSDLFSRNALITNSERKSTNSVQTLPNTEPALRPQKKDFTRDWKIITDEMNDWIVEEDSIIVNCGTYVWTVIATATILVVGGLVIGFTVGSRIRGVDPFNITTYAWVLAAFIVLVSKSTKVENWTWRDFLLRRVRCRSVSELKGITGINEQLILAKLLHDEERTILTTRGPYNAVFKRKSEAGLSIDCPLNTRTMLISGLTMLKVMTAQGHALVCLDSRRGTGLVLVEHRGLSRRDYLICEDITRRMHNPKYPGLIRLQLKSSKLFWKKVQGVYNDLDTVFV